MINTCFKYLALCTNNNPALGAITIIFCLLDGCLHTNFFNQNIHSRIDSIQEVFEGGVHSIECGDREMCRCDWVSSWPGAPSSTPPPNSLARAHDHQLIVWSGAALARFTARDEGPTDSTTTTKKCGQERYKYSSMNYNYKAARKYMTTLPDSWPSIVCNQRQGKNTNNNTTCWPLLD